MWNKGITKEENLRQEGRTTFSTERGRWGEMTMFSGERGRTGKDFLKKVTSVFSIGRREVWLLKVKC